jgi:ABC-type multidrug transport system permease subunit
LKQNIYQFRRIFICKLRNKLNILVTFAIPPALSILTSILLRFTPESLESYHFAYNNQYSTFLFLVVIVGIFFGLSNSVTDIIKDRLTLRREKLLNISFFGYIISKFIVLVTFAVIQSILFILPAHLILEEFNLVFVNIGLMTLISSCGIGFGLLVSTFLKSSIAAYNLVPLILVPQIILGGALVQYKELNQQLLFIKKSPIPPPAQIMFSRWGYEMLMTANYELHPYFRYMNELQEKKDELANRLITKQITKEQQLLINKEVNKKYTKLLSQTKSSVNKQIEELTFLFDGQYLSINNKWFDGSIKTWVRDFWILVFYNFFLILLCYIRLRTMKT